MKKKSFFSRVVTKIALFCALLGFPVGVASAQSGPRLEKPKVTLVVSGLSWHFQDRDRFNWFNYGIGIEYRVSDKFHVSAGGYKNSIGRNSFYATGGWETQGYKPFGAGVEVGVITGYNFGIPVKGVRILPAAAPYFRAASRDGLNAKITVIPPIGEIVSVAGLQLRVPTK